MKTTTLGLSLLTCLAAATIAHAESRMLLRDRFEPADALDEMVTAGASLGVDAPISLDRFRYLDGESALAMGGVAHELRVTHALRDPGGALGASVYVFVEDDDRPKAYFEIGFTTGEPVRVGVGRDGRLLMEGPGTGPAPRVSFEEGWVEITVHRDDDRFRIFTPHVVVAQWDEPRSWSSVSLVRAGPADAVAWFDDLRISTGSPHFMVRRQEDASRRARLPRIGLRGGVAPIFDPSDVDPGVNVELDYMLGVREDLRLGVEAGLQNGEWLGDDAALAEVWLLGALVERDLGRQGFLARGELGIGRLDAGSSSRFLWFGAGVGFRWRVRPRLIVVPSVGIRRFETDVAITEVPFAVTLRWANEMPGTRVSHRP